MLRSLLTLMSGGVFRQVSMIAALPVLSRLYDAEAFGQLSAVMAMVSLSAVVVHGRYHLAVPVAVDDEEAADLCRLALLASLSLSLPAVWLVWFVFGRVEDAATTVALATAITFATATADVAAYWRARVKRFAASARIDAGRAVATLAGQFALVPLGALGLIFGTLGGAVTAAALGAWTVRSVRDLSTSATRLLKVARTYRSYPLFGVPQGWMASASHNLMPLLLLKFASLAFVGQYWLAYRLMLTPVALVGHTYRQAVLSDLKGGMTASNIETCRQHTLALLALGLIPCTLLILHGELIFALLLGSGWAQAGAIAGWLGIAFMADAFKIPTVTLLQAAGRQRDILVWEAGIFASRYGIAVPLLLDGRPMAAIGAYACTGMICWTAFCIAQLRRRRSPMTA